MKRLSVLLISLMALAASVTAQIHYDGNFAVGGKAGVTLVARQL